MGLGVLAWQPIVWLQLIERELLLFALVWLLIGMADELLVDVVWLTLRLLRPAAMPFGPAEHRRTLSGQAAVLIPAWQEAAVIGATVAHLLAAWPQRQFRLYVGTYRNDPATVAAVMAASGNDPRLRIVIHPKDGPTTKADCLNRLYGAIVDDEAQTRRRYRSVILHDAEDMVHPLALDLIDVGLGSADFVQLPVRPELIARRAPGAKGAPGWIIGHYADEFAESHGKAMVVRDWLGGGLPGAGVGCGIGRDMLERIVQQRRQAGGRGPFAPDCLTEDYEFGLLIARVGGRGRFLRRRDPAGALIATRAFFPATLASAVRQKARWIHGIALQGWDRLGWQGGVIARWMALRDRRGPLAALVLASAYLLLVIEALLGGLRWLAAMYGINPPPLPPSPEVRSMLVISLCGVVWRAMWRLAWTAREYGLAEGCRAVLRIPLANIIAIMAGRRALAAYLRTLGGEAIVWDKTEHLTHPALARLSAA